MTLNPSKLYDAFIREGIDFFTGVPDSTLKYFCFYLDDHSKSSNHIITANEGNSIALAAGYHISTGKVPLVYMQNSGLGNAINPLTSLVGNDLFAIPMIVLVGWRGEPGKKDAIQHSKDGQMQLQLLETLGLSYTIIPSATKSLEIQIQDSIRLARATESPHVILVRKDTFEKYESSKSNKSNKHLMSREYALTKILQGIEPGSIIVSTTGKTSRELYEIRRELGKNDSIDLMLVGSMGHASSLSLGVALENNNRNVFCIDGDGSLIMHMGALSTIGKYSPSNFRHILLNNFSHDSVGGQESSSDIIDFDALSKAVSYNNYFEISDKSEFGKTFSNFQRALGPSFLQIPISKGSRVSLSRPDLTPYQNKKEFMDFLGL